MIYHHSFVTEKGLTNMAWFKNSKNSIAINSNLAETNNKDLFIKNSLNVTAEEFSPVKYDEVEPIANTLVLGKSIKLNLQNTQPADRKRIIDFLCGIAFVLDLDVKCTANNIYEFNRNKI